MVPRVYCASESPCEAALLYQRAASAWSWGTPRPRAYIIPSSICASMFPCAAASRYQRAAASSSWPTPRPGYISVCKAILRVRMSLLGGREEPANRPPPSRGRRPGPRHTLSRRRTAPPYAPVRRPFGTSAAPPFRPGARRGPRHGGCRVGIAPAQNPARRPRNTSAPLRRSPGARPRPASYISPRRYCASASALLGGRSERAHGVGIVQVADSTFGVHVLKTGPGIRIA